jgi:hypothetical protein
MFEALFTALGAAFSIWDHKEKHKYQEQLIRLKIEYYEEANKDPDIRDHAVLDNISFSLRILSDAFGSAIGESDPVDKS